MKTGYLIIPALLFLAACSEPTALYYPESESVSVVLPVRSLSGTNAPESRAAVDTWDQTMVSLAYRVAPQPVYTDRVNVEVKTEADQIIHLGMQYPDDDSEFHVRGYHPVAAPDAAGIVPYDLSKADLDLMCTDEVHGNKSAPIIASESNKLQFRHLLTRLTFKMMCAPGSSYPEWIAAVIINGNAGQPFLPTQARLDLGDGSVAFRAPGTIMAGYSAEGFRVPQYANPANPAVIDAMVKAGAPLSIQILTTNDNLVNIGLAGSPISTLETTGGESGKQYIINLSFSSTSILIDQIGIIEWGAGGTMPNQPAGTDPWW